LNGEWVPPDLRDEVIDYVRYWSDRTALAKTQLVRWVEISRSKYYDWRSRYGKVNEHNAWIPRDHWLEEWEHKAIRMFYSTHPDEGYRRLTYMMMDTDVVAVSPTSVYRVLSAAGLLERWNKKVSKKGNGFTQPLTAHAHWHTDIMYLNLYGTFYYLISVLDGYSRYVVEWDIRESMTERDVEIVIQKAKERYPEAHPRLISDNGKQFMAKEFKEFIRFHGMSHVTTSPYYPQSNGKIERWHQSLQHECIRPGTPLSVQDARRIVEKYVDRYNNERLHSAIGYVTPRDKLEGRADKIHAERDLKLEQARARRKRNRQERENALTVKEWYVKSSISRLNRSRQCWGATCEG